jgi:hypothetical protein
VVEKISHDPDELLAAYAKQQEDIQNLRDQLKGILSDALGDVSGAVKGRAGAARK